MSMSMDVVVIPREEYAELIKTVERVETLKRMLAVSDYIHESNLRIIFNINKKEIGNETV